MFFKVYIGKNGESKSENERCRSQHDGRIAKICQGVGEGDLEVIQLAENTGIVLEDHSGDVPENDHGNDGRQQGRESPSEMCQTTPEGLTLPLNRSGNANSSFDTLMESKGNADHLFRAQRVVNVAFCNIPVVLVKIHRV